MTLITGAEYVRLLEPAFGDSLPGPSALREAAKRSSVSSTVYPGFDVKHDRLEQRHGEGVF